MFNMGGRQMDKMMKQMGIKSEKIDADEVIIRSGAKEIVIENPDVTKINMQGHETFQVMGKVTERKAGPSEDDIKMVMEQTGATEEEVRKSLEETGDIAESILNLKK